MNSLHPNTMTSTAHLTTIGLALMLAIAASGARAGEGHDHDDAPAATAGSALPRFAASSELFELVGILDGKRLSLYLDHAPDNRPVQGATLELEFGGTKLDVRSHADGEFEATLAEAPHEGVIAVTATVIAGQDTDLLAGELDLHVDEAAGAAPPAMRWTRWAGWGLAVLAGLGLAGWTVARRRSQRVGGAA